MNMPDGSMLISDDWNGAVYRLTYGASKKVAGR
jgi:glucose/arabinose dehydrogenase